jgi:cyanophycin synthetase
MRPRSRVYCRARLIGVVGSGEIGGGAGSGVVKSGRAMTAGELVETRTLDGANIYLREPAIKLQFHARQPSADGLAAAVARWHAATTGVVGSSQATDGDLLDRLLWPIVRELHAALALPVPPQATARGPSRAGGPQELTLAFGWAWRGTAEGIAETSFGLMNALLAGDAPDLAACLAPLRAALARDRATGDRPLFVRDAERRLPLAAITGTNGKTTTTRCLAHLLTVAGRRVGMANSNGVWLGDERVLDGDYTGPQGARRVLADATLDTAVLETARGGILRRGIAYESNDVGVVTNISADHLGLQGIATLEELARVKELVVRLTRPTGLVVLNADDPLVAAMARAVRAPVLFFSRQPTNPTIAAHLAAGGRALLDGGGVLVLAEGARRVPIVPLAEVPLTFGGRATHMVENALAAAGAALGLGLDPATIAAGLRGFRNSPEQNFGRLNAFAIAEPPCTFIVDYAHNEAGLAHLLAFGRGYVAPGARLLAIIGTAGDRADAVLRGIGRQAGAGAAFVWVRGTERYLRGRSGEAMDRLFVAGIVEGRAGAAGGYALVADELAAVEAALAEARPGDAIAMMCFEEQGAVLARLATRGTVLAG